MKTSFYLSSRTRGSLLLLVLATLAAPNAQCGLPFKRTLGAIKERVSHVVRKIGSEVDRESAGPNRPVTPDSDPRYGPPPLSQYQQSRPVTPDRDLRYGPPPFSQYQQRSPERPSSSPDEPRRNASEVIYSASAFEPASILRKPQSTTGGAVVPVTIPGSQPAEPGTMPALKDLPMTSAADAQTSSSSSTDPASRNTEEPQAAPQAAPSPQPVNYAKPVPGHPGFVYPPGVKEELKSMLDVRGCASGEKMRDPRTGNTFLVP
ncbi:hypothetical protein BH11VER1_BH11VER1_23980 [soil metagenome]